MFICIFCFPWLDFTWIYRKTSVKKRIENPKECKPECGQHFPSRRVQDSKTNTSRPGLFQRDDSRSVFEIGI